MEKLRFRTSANKNGQIETIEIGGLLVLETAIQLKNELVIIAENLHKVIRIHIFDLEEMDLTGVQLLVAFFRFLKQKKIKYDIDWDLDEDQKTFFTNIGIGLDLNMNN